MTTLDELRAELQKNPTYRAAEEQLRPYVRISDAVLRKRLELGWSCKELAEKAGVGLRTVYRIEAFECENVRLNKLLAVLKVLGLSLRIGLVDCFAEDEPEPVENADKP